MGIIHILVGDSEKAELADEMSDLVIRPRLLHPPDGLCQRVGSTPGCHIDGTWVILIDQSDEQLAAWRVVALADGADATIHTTHHGPAAQVVSTRPVADFLTSGFLHY